MNMHLLQRPFLAKRVVISLLAIVLMARAGADPVTLKDTFKEHFLVGAAVNRSMVSTGPAFRRSPEQTAKDVALLKQQFNQITAENDMKWALIHPREGKEGYDFGPADAFVNFGLSNNMYLVGHTLVWHSQTPNWVFAGTNPPPASVTNGANAPAATDANVSTNRGRFGGGFGRYNGPRASREELLERMREHIHTVVRTPNGNDYGKDLLRQHYQLHAH